MPSVCQLPCVNAGWIKHYEFPDIVKAPRNTGCLKHPSVYDLKELVINRAVMEDLVMPVSVAFPAGVPKRYRDVAMPVRVPERGSIFLAKIGFCLG